jgi:hypothetical protein
MVRSRRAATALINGGLLKALQYYLKELCEQPYEEDYALKYFSGNAEDKRATQLESGGIQMFDRLVAARENGRRLLRKEVTAPRSRSRRNQRTTEAHRWQPDGKSRPTA